MGYSGAGRNLFHEKNQKQKIWWHCPFNGQYFYFKKTVFQTKGSQMTRYIFFATISQAKLYETDQLGGKVESRSMTFGYGSGSTNLYLWLKDSDQTPASDPGIFASDLQEDNKNF